VIAARRLLALALLAPLTGAGLLVAATPAYAAGSITAPGAGVVYSSDTTVRMRAEISTTDTTQLRLKSPVASSVEQVVDSGSGTLTNNSAALAYDLDTSCATFPSSSCSGRAPAANGVWTIRLTGGATDRSTFVLRIPPRAPGSVTARAEGTRAVVVSWRKGEEPDLTGWILYGDGGVAQDGIGLSACSGTSCSTTVTYAQDGTGEHTYSLVALRRVSPDSSETIGSARSAEASATLTAPPPSPPPSSEPQPDGSGTGGSPAPSGEPDTGSGTPSGSGSGSGGTTSGGSGTGSTGGGGTTGGGTATGSGGPAGIGTSTSPATAIAQRRAFALTFKAFGPKLGIPKLPPLPATQPAVALPDGTFEGTLGYKDVVTREKVSAPQAAADRVTDVVDSALDSDQFLRSLAGALILLLAAAHLRRWLGSSSHE
jgi:uncharacterized membrane protein YgcG